MKRGRIAVWVLAILLVFGAVYWFGVRPSDNELVVVAAEAAIRAKTPQDWAEADTAFARVQKRWAPDSDAVVSLDKIRHSFRYNLSIDQAGYDAGDLCASLIERYWEE